MNYEDKTTILLIVLRRKDIHIKFRMVLALTKVILFE